MENRYFTPEEANETLAEVRPLAERMVAHRQALAEAREAQAELAARVGGNGGGIEPRTFSELEARIEQEEGGVVRCLTAIQELGVLVKDLDRGLVDFPARRGAEEVLLCWRVGEPEVAHWHGADEGFSGRQPLPL